MKLDKYHLAFIPLAVALNVSMGSIIQLLKLPIYLDAIGTCLVTLSLGFRAGALTGVLSFLIAGIVISPVYPYFIGTQVAIAGFLHLVASQGLLAKTWTQILCGIALGVIAGACSAPVKVFLFAGIDGSGTSLVIAYFLKSGQTMLNSVLYSGLASEPLDKTLQLLMTVIMLKSIPRRLLVNFDNPLLRKNGFLI
ncbi:hypothetical protein [Dyadobacter bucti]|uniref:hypothetical protein n=1 Tax=Dyadobacter bucti TaxID=2572203 RepID=UPI001108F632|nr:hypothetical protein [Dyadobacter bucti]